MKKSVLLFLGLLLFGSANVLAQTKTITGKVTASDDDSGIPGATVQIKGTAIATQTDLNGDYSIKASPDQTLLFSFIGFTTAQEVTGTRTIINVVLESDLKSLDEVIISGVAGATDKKKMTVSVTKIGEAQLNAVPATSLSSALTGKVAGLRTSSVGGAPGQQVDLLLRGDNVINGSSSPLILIDGIIMNGSLADINVDDVESMEVIKGAAAAALYGSRAGAGVISITSKRGKSGSFGKPQITFRNEIGFQNLQHYLETANSHMYKLADDWENYKGQFTKYANVTYPAGYEGGYNPDIKGSRGIDDDGYMDNPYGVYRFNPADIFKTGTTYTNYVGISNRTEKNNIFLSFENNNQGGVIKMRDGYSRQNFRFNIDQELTKWLRISATNLFINRSVQAPSGIFYPVARMEKDIRLFDENPDGQPYRFRVNNFNAEVTNPLYPLYKQKTKDNSRRWMGNYTGNIHFANWVNLDLTQTIEIENRRTELINPKDTYNAAGIYTNGDLRQRSYETQTYNTQATLNLNHKFRELDIKGKLSYLYENRHYEFTETYAQTFLIQGIENFKNFANITSANSDITDERAQNYFAILGLDYKDRYLFDGMVRHDGSSLFGPESRWNTYYRLSGAYRLTKDIMIPGVEELKIRLAHGTAGLRPDFAWQYEVYGLSQGVASPSQKGNRALKPSTTKETEIGLNVDFLKRFTFEGVFAKSKTNDQFLQIPLVSFLNDGFTSQWQNAGTVESNTFEFTLAANWIKKKDFSWNSNFVFSRVRQKITSLPRPAYYISAYTGDVSAFRIAEGEVYGAIYGRRMVRTLDEMSRQLPEGASISDYQVNREGYVIAAGTEGKTSETPILYRENGEIWVGKIGDGNAQFNMGIANTFNFKGITLYALLDWKNGGDVYNSNNQRLAFNNVSITQDMTNVPQDQKKAASYWGTGMYDANNPNAYWVENASYLKLREVAVGYTIPNKIMNRFLKGNIKGVNIKAVGRNLLTFSGYTGYDPEVGTLRQPIDGIGASPIYRSFAFSLGFNL